MKRLIIIAAAALAVSPAFAQHYGDFSGGALLTPNTGLNWTPPTYAAPPSYSYQPPIMRQPQICTRSCFAGICTDTCF